MSYQKIFGSLIQACRTGLWATADSFRNFPLITAAAWSVSLFMMAIPALQVWTVRYSSEIIQSDFTSSFFGVSVFVALTASLLSVTSSICASVQKILQMNLRSHYSSEFSNTVKNITPAQALDYKFMEKIRAAREAIPFNLAWQATSVITVVSSVISMILLAFSLWSIHPWAALLIAFALLPDLFTYSRVAAKENQIWQQTSVISRRIDYLEQLQDYQPAAVELATQQGAFGIPDELAKQQQKFAKLWNEVPRKSMKLALISNLGVFALVLIAIVVVISADTNTIDIASAMLGIISGLTVTHNVGAACGELMATTPLVIAHKKLILQLKKNCKAEPLLGPISVKIDAVTYKYPSFLPPESDTASEENNHDKYDTARKVVAIDNLSLYIAPGSIVALVGENGSGKTTLAKLIAGLIEPTQGQILCTSKNKESASALIRQASASIVFQDFSQFELPIKDFIDPAGTQDSATIQDSLERARISDLVNNFANGLHTMLGPQWNGVGLSGGQWQRMALARTFLSQAPLWILDEPTAAVDAIAESAIYRDVIAAKPDYTTVIIISHRPQTLKNVDLIAVMDEGKIIEQGTYEELMSNDGKFKELASLS